MKTRFAFEFSCVFFSLLFALPNAMFGQDASDGSGRSLGSELDHYFAGIMQKQQFVALGACLIVGDSIRWDGYYGYSNLEAKRPLKRNDIFQLASLSKTVTATALMKLYEKGMFQLDDDINNYLPFKVRNPNFPEKPITYRMLLTHTSSLEDVLSNGLKVPKGVPYPRGVAGDSNMPLSELMKELFTPGGKYYSGEYFSTSEPGTKYSYSNFAFSLIGYLVETIAKKDFSEYCKDNIFQPLGMTSTAWRLRDLDTSRVVFGYGFPDNDSIPVYKRIQHFGEPGYPAGNLRTSMHDFATFVGAFMNKGRQNDYQLLKPETVELMTNPQGIKNISTRAFKITDIGLAWLIFDVEGEQLYSMNGFSGSIFTNTYFSPKNRTGIIYFYTGIRMRTMPAMIDITKKLCESTKMFD
jgi:CubicO group peptidase (beta-lactamase class C family)